MIMYNSYSFVIRQGIHLAAHSKSSVMVLEVAVVAAEVAMATVEVAVVVVVVVMWLVTVVLKTPMMLVVETVMMRRVGFQDAQEHEDVCHYPLIAAFALLMQDNYP